eukprot:2880640-Rhodomonas_salina.1
MTALLSHDAEDDKIAPVEVARQKKREEPERKGGGEGGGGGADGKKGAEVLRVWRWRVLAGCCRLLLLSVVVLRCARVWAVRRGPGDVGVL